MADHQIIRRPVPQLPLQVLKEFRRLSLVHCIHHSNLLIHNDIRIISNSVWNYVLSLKKIQIPVIYANITNVFRNRNHVGTSKNRLFRLLSPSEHTVYSLRAAHSNSINITARKTRNGYDLPSISMI